MTDYPARPSTPEDRLNEAIDILVHTFLNPEEMLAAVLSPLDDSRRLAMRVKVISVLLAWDEYRGNERALTTVSSDRAPLT